MSCLLCQHPHDLQAGVLQVLSGCCIAMRMQRLPASLSEESFLTCAAASAGRWYDGRDWRGGRDGFCVGLCG